MISITCTHCKTLLEMDDAFAGGVCRCQHCGTIQTVPSQLKRPATPQVAASADSVCEPGYGCFSGLAAFDGFATSHALSVSGVWMPSRNFTASLIALHYDDFPVPIPDYYGRIPDQIRADVRIRLSKNILLDISRSYYFGFGGNRWNPGSTFGVLP